MLVEDPLACSLRFSLHFQSRLSLAVSMRAIQVRQLTLVLVASMRMQLHPELGLDEAIRDTYLGINLSMGFIEEHRTSKSSTPTSEAWKVTRTSVRQARHLSGQPPQRL